VLHVSRRVNTGFSPRNKLAMKPGAKLSSTTISARARAMSPARALQAIIGARQIGARCETWIADSHQRTASAWLRSVKCAIASKVRGSDPVAPRAQSQRKLGVRFRLLGQAVGEILLFGIAAHVLKRQHGDRRFVGQWKRLGGLD
jgi:hypothetical protein